MNKIALVTDTHFGINFSKNILGINLDFFIKVFFPFLLKNNIKTVYHLGDFYHSRNILDVYVKNEVENKFLQFFEDNKIHLNIILGNHDIYYKNTLEVNSLSNYESNYIHIISDIETKTELNRLTITSIPWITDKSLIDFNSLEKSDVILGHFEIGHKLLDKVFNKRDTIDYKTIANKANLILSGHFHVKTSLTDKFLYLGTPYQLNWGDFNTTRGFYTLDENMNLEFIENTFSPKFVEIYYNDQPNKKLSLRSLGTNHKVVRPEKIINPRQLVEIVENNYIKLIVESIDSQSKFDSFYKGVLKYTKFPIKLVMTDSPVCINSTLDDSSLGSESILETITEYLKLQDTSNLDMKVINSTIDYIYKKSLENIGDQV